MSKQIFMTVACWMTLSLSCYAQHSKLNIVVDEKMELLTVIQYLSGYPILTQANIQYKKDIDDYFKNFRNHDAVQLNKKIYRRFFAFDAPPTYVYHFSFPDFKQIAPFSKEDSGYHFEANRDTLSMLLQAFSDFYKQSQFHTFYTAHRPFYDSLAAPVIRKLAATDIINIIEAHYGEAKKAYKIVLAPMMNDGGYGLNINDTLYAIIGPRMDSKEVPEFDIDNLLSEYIIHEFSHSFTNPFITAHTDELIKDSCLFVPIQAAMAEQGYGNWTGSLYEHFVRANEIVINETVFGKEHAIALYHDMVENGKWIYLKGLLHIVQTYARNRTQYKTLKAVMPEVIEYFHKSAAACK